MTRTISRIVFAAAIVLSAAGATQAEAGGYVGLEVSNNGVGFAFGSSNWGIWGSSWNSGGPSFGFSATLSGYGEWVQVVGLGQVWRPWVAAGWQPYTHGRWVWTSIGWTWVAYEPWGWVPHHYGNWAYSTVGWVWSPGYVYNPGNVVWVSSGIHVGWYPCAPRGWSHFNRGYAHGWNDGYATGRYDGYATGYADGWRDARYATWVPWSSVTADNVAHYAVHHEVVTRQVARTRVSAMATPPTRAEVERRVGRPVPEARVVERKATIDGREVRVVRPDGGEPDVRRYGAETVERALAPDARKRAAGGDARSAPSAGAGRAAAERPMSTATREIPTSRHAATPRSTQPSRTDSRAPVTVNSRSAKEIPVNRSPAADRRRPASESRANAAPYDARKGHAEDVPVRSTSRRASASVEPRARTAAPVDTPSPKPPRERSSARRVAPESTKETVSKSRRSPPRPSADPAKESRRKPRKPKD